MWEEEEMRMARVKNKKNLIDKFTIDRLLMRVMKKKNNYRQL